MNIVTFAIIGGLLGGLCWQSIGLFYWRDKFMKLQAKSNTVKPADQTTPIAQKNEQNRKL